MSCGTDEILTVDEVAAYLKAGKRTASRLAESGTLPAYKLGGTWRFRPADLDARIKSKTASAANVQGKRAIG